jgi:hypothetical protein
VVNDLLESPVEPPARVEVEVPSRAGGGPRRRLVVATGGLVLLLAGGGVWWRAVTADPGLEFYGGPNVFRDEAGDTSGIREVRNLLGSEVDVAFVPGGPLFVSVGLYNGGRRDVRIERMARDGFYYWGFDRMAVSVDRQTGFVGVAGHYRPFEPFTLHPGETKNVRLEFHLADCDPAGLQAGGTSSLDALPLTYRTLGVTRTTAVPFRDMVLAVQAMGACDHPVYHDGATG